MNIISDYQNYEAKLYVMRQKAEAIASGAPNILADNSPHLIAWYQAVEGWKSSGVWAKKRVLYPLYGGNATPTAMTLLNQNPILLNAVNLSANGVVVIPTASFPITYSNFGITGSQIAVSTNHSIIKTGLFNNQFVPSGYTFGIYCNQFGITNNMHGALGMSFTAGYVIGGNANYTVNPFCDSVFLAPNIFPNSFPTGFAGYQASTSVAIPTHVNNPLNYGMFHATRNSASYGECRHNGMIRTETVEGFINPNRLTMITQPVRIAEVYFMGVNQLIAENNARGASSRYGLLSLSTPLTYDEIQSDASITQSLMKSWGRFVSP
jgi:hypothetical protein